MKEQGKLRLSPGQEDRRCLPSGRAWRSAGCCWEWIGSSDVGRSKSPFKKCALILGGDAATIVWPGYRAHHPRSVGLVLADHPASSPGGPAPPTLCPADSLVCQALFTRPMAKQEISPDPFFPHNRATRSARPAALKPGDWQYWMMVFSRTSTWRTAWGMSDAISGGI